MVYSALEEIVIDEAWIRRPFEATRKYMVLHRMCSGPVHRLETVGGIVEAGR